MGRREVVAVAVEVGKRRVEYVGERKGAGGGAWGGSGKKLIDN